MGRYANILLDYWFKRTFGAESRKRILELFLKELIPERKIVSLKYEPQEHINPWPGKKDIRVDVECTDADGTRFVVEMQLAEQEFFYERALFNSSFAIQEQMVKGQDEYDFPTVYFIGLTDFSMHEDTTQVLYRYRLREDHSNEVMTERVQYIFLELPNCKDEPKRDAPVVDKICWALHNLPSFEDRPSVLEEEIFRLLFESAEIATFTPEEKIKYEHDMTTERDIRNQIRFAEKQGLAKGREEGRAEGREEGATQKSIEIARQMLAERIPAETVAKCTGLSKEDIAAL